MSQPVSMNGRRPSVSASDPPSYIPIPSNPRSVPPSAYGQLSPSANVSTSPLANYAAFSTSPHQGTGATATTPGSLGRGRSLSSVNNFGVARQLTNFLPPSYPLEEEDEDNGPNGSGASNKRQGKTRILLLENINLEAAEFLRRSGYEVEHKPAAWTEEDLLKKLQPYAAIGIRSKTKITAKVIDANPQLRVIGCFCIGTNQVDLVHAAKAGIAVFNSPFANSRSVAELVISEMIALARQFVDRTIELRQGVWQKVSKGCWEIRGKTLGIVGYGHIGSQLSVLAEAFGMSVIYYDVIPIMPLGTARQMDTLQEMLSKADFVTLHVPEIPDTIGMMGAEEFAQMKSGAYFINNARGKVVDLDALCSAVESKHLAGAAIDVFPKEPGSNGPGFDDSLGDFIPRLRALTNVILTPHIGGSTEEAQRAIGSEVSSALLRYLNYGTTLGSVNFPEVDLRAITTADERHIRLCFVHRNEPGVLKVVNNILADHNIEKQFSDSKGDIAYLMADISGVGQEEVADVYAQISGTKANILTRLLY